MNNPVILENVKGFSSSEYASSPNGCQAKLLEVLKIPISYEDLICYNGFAYRIGIHEKMCPSAGHPSCGFSCPDGPDKAQPWNFKGFYSAPWDPAKKDRAAFEAEACAAIKQSIDKGLPVHYGGEEEGLIIGYADNGRRWRCLHPNYENGQKTFWHDEADGFAGGKWPWFITIWTEPKPQEELLNDRDLTLIGLKQAVEMWKTKKRDAYFVGAAAYKHWLDWLNQVEAGKINNPKDGMQGNAWCFYVLIQNRRIAGRWLKQQAGKFEGVTSEQLSIAADHFSKIPEICMKNLKSSWDLALAPDRDNEWSSEHRQKQISRLKAAREHDKAAISAIEKALSSLK